MVEITPSGAVDDGHFVRGELQPFRSPITGEWIDSRSKYAAHCQRHNVVPTEELRGNKGEGDRYAANRERRALRERLWEGVDRAMNRR
jgi:hypothetical protein